MKRLLSLAAALLCCMTVTHAQVSNDNEDGVNKVDHRAMNDFVPGQVLVKFRDGQAIQTRTSNRRFFSTNIGRLTSILQKYGTQEMEQLVPQKKSMTFNARRAKAYNNETIEEHDLSQLYQVKLDETHTYLTHELIEELQQLSEVEYAEPNYLLYTMEDVTLNANYSGNTYLNSQWYLEDYGLKELWTKPIINNKRPIIAILDTGVDITHPDLEANIWTNQGEYMGEKGYDNDYNGYQNDLHGWDFINNSPNIRDNNMHGTHVAGIAAASNNNIGIIGANPRAYIMPVTVMQSDGSGDVATIVRGIEYAVANGATILNLSLGTYANSRALRQALERAYQSAVIVAAAGNDGLAIYPTCGDRLSKPMFPAAYSFVLGVQATGSNGNLASFSNYDCDGPTTSGITSSEDPDGFNYEIEAPGVNMFSTVPGGNYKSLNGTSMAAPLVAGAISALQMVKHYNTQEILWGDLIHSSTIIGAYNIVNRPSELDLMCIMYRERKEMSEATDEDYSEDGRIDAGETVSLYPVIRTTFGEASNIKLHLEMGDEYEDPNAVQILTGIVDFGWHLDAYGKEVSLNPLILKVADNVANGRHIKMKVVATCDETTTVFQGLFTMIIDNMSKIGGLIDHDMTLSADHEYLVTRNLAIPSGVSLTVEPGTTINFDGCGISNSGTINMDGTPQKPITLKSVTDDRWTGLSLGRNNSISYCIIEKGDISSNATGVFNHCQFYDCSIGKGFTGYKIFNHCNFISGGMASTYGSFETTGCNYFDINMGGTYYSIPENNSKNDNIINAQNYALYSNVSSPTIISMENMPYLGTSREDIARQWIADINNDNGFGQFDLDNMPIRPYEEAHGIVWKVCVNGKDAQDEYEDLAPLGTKKHKFEVYFNRSMNKEVAPMITFGVRDPWTQNVVNENGSWNSDGTIYTAYKTITGKTKSDGVNRIYVSGAEDNEYFEIPYEKTRFNINIQAAGSMATGFAAEAGLGRVTLTWNNDQNDFDDAMGFNIYRYMEGQGEENAVCINQSIVDVETTEYTDYDVVPGNTYYYMYKVLSTDLQEYDVSNVVAVTPQTATRGDADGSGDVKVGDIITTVNYILGEQPKPFIFEAADINSDQYIDVLDVIGIIQSILNQPVGSRFSIEGVAEAVYTIEDGVLYVETPVTLSGLQVQLSDAQSTIHHSQFATSSDMKGFELAFTWLTENDYRMLAYSFGSKTLAPGKHAIMTIGDADITSLRLADIDGRNVNAVAGEATIVKDAMGSKVMTAKGVYNLSGQKVAGKDNSKLRKGVYIIDGQKIVK